MKIIVDLEDDFQALSITNGVALISIYFVSKIIKNNDMSTIFIGIYGIAAILHGVTVVMINNESLRQLTLIPLMVGHSVYMVHETLLIKYVAECQLDYRQSYILMVSVLFRGIVNYLFDFFVEDQYELLDDKITTLSYMFQAFAIINFMMGLVTLFGFKFNTHERKLTPVF